MNIADPGLGNSSAFGSLQVTWAVVRHVLILLACGLTTGLVVLGTCCGCGYGAYAAWTRVGSPLRRQNGFRPRSGDALDDSNPSADPIEAQYPIEAQDPIEAEAARGIAEIEWYLSSRCPHPGPPGTSTNEHGQPLPPAESQ